jgi:precorrin-4 methylase
MKQLKLTVVVATLLRVPKKNTLVVVIRSRSWKKSVTLPKRNILAVVIRLLRSKAKETPQSQLMRVVETLLPVLKKSTPAAVIRSRSWRENVTPLKTSILGVVTRSLRSKAKETLQSQLMKDAVMPLLVPKESTPAVVTESQS